MAAIRQATATATASAPMDAHPPVAGAAAGERLFARYARLLAPLLAGYLIGDRAFAYLHLPGTPLYVGELVLVVGVVAALAGTGYLLTPINQEPLLALLVVFMVWGLVRTVPGLGSYGTDAVRDSVLWYYGAFALLTAAALAASPDLLDRLPGRLSRLTPWLLLAQPIALVLGPVTDQQGPYIPFSDASVLSHKPGNCALAALIALGGMWLLPGHRTSRSRAWWSVLALLVIALSATQNRGGFLGVAAGVAVGLVFVANGRKLAVRLLLAAGAGLAIIALVPFHAPITGAQGREFSSDQLIANVLSLGGKQEPGNLGGTVQGRQELWSKILAKQEDDGHMVDGSGFGPNLAAQVGVYDQARGDDTLRSPHNSHLDVMARMGLVGLTFWIALWSGWFWRLATGCRRLARSGLLGRQRIGVLCLAIATDILVSSLFDPQLEGPQIGILLWTVFGVGVAVTTTRSWCTYRGATATDAGRPVPPSRARPRE